MKAYPESVHEQAHALAAEGLGYKRIGKRLGIPPPTIRRWLNPVKAAREREANLARKQRYRGSCLDCGCPTAWPGSGGPPVRCLPCHRAFIERPHGTLGRYQAGCRCPDCRRANADWQRVYQDNRRREEGVLKRRRAA